MNITSEELLKEARALEPQLQQWRRTLHRHPEVGFDLPHTKELVKKAPERVVQRRPDERPQRRRFRFQPETPQRIPHRIDDPRLRVRQRPVQIKEYCFVLHVSLLRPSFTLRNLGQGR